MAESNEHEDLPTGDNMEPDPTTRKIMCVQAVALGYGKDEEGFVKWMTSPFLGLDISAQQARKMFATLHSEG